MNLTWSRFSISRSTRPARWPAGRTCEGLSGLLGSRPRCRGLLRRLPKGARITSLGASVLLGQCLTAVTQTCGRLRTSSVPPPCMQITQVASCVPERGCSSHASAPESGLVRVSDVVQDPGPLSGEPGVLGPQVDPLVQDLPVASDLHRDKLTSVGFVGLDFAMFGRRHDYGSPITGHSAGPAGMPASVFSLVKGEVLPSGPQIT